MSDNVYRTIPEQISEQLRKQILSGELAPGSPLREQELSDRFQVSRGPIRDSLRRLTQDGLVTWQPNIGARVADKPSHELRELVAEVRARIETFALCRTFAKITDSDLVAWDQILTRIHNACERGDVAELVENDIRFHRALIQSHDDQHLHELWHPIVMRMMMDYSRFTDLTDSYEEHRRILQAIRERDLDSASAALRANIR